MSTLNIKMLPDIIRTVAGNKPITSGTYLPLLTTQSTPVGPFAYPIRIFHLQNLTDQPCVFSFAAPGSAVPPTNGTADHVVINSESFLLLDITSDSTMPGGEFYMQQGTTVYVRALSASTTLGAVWLSVFYGRNIL
jgi:hypothetical protein